MGFHSKRTRRRRRRKNKKQKQPRKGNFVEDLPMDISMDILKRLPVTSLMSFKLVSKACYNLVRATNVVLAPPRHYQENSYCLIIINPDIDHDYPLYLIDNGVVARRIDGPNIPRRYYSGAILSSNGLLCLLFYYGIGRRLFTKSYYYRVCLYNPLTNEHDFLPDPEVSIFDKSRNKKIRATHDEYKFGFGFNTSTNEHKVVRLVRTYEMVTGLYGLEATHVFTLGKKGCQWSESNKPFLFPEASSDIVVDNAIHWLCEDDEEEQFSGLHAILSFDLFEEKFHRIPNPSNCEMRHCKLSVLGGCLAVTNLDYILEEVVVWVLKEYGVKESWIRELAIRSFPPMPRVFNIQPFFRLKSGKIVILFDDKVIYSYDPTDGTFENIHPRGISQDEFLTAIYHTPTLISPLFI